LDFARIWDQAKELWARPIGKLLLGGAAVFLIVAAGLSYVWSRPTYVKLGTFEATDATKVAQKLNEAKIPYQQSGTGYTFEVQDGDAPRAKLALAEINLDPQSTMWSLEPWTGNNWNNTEFDKRQIWVDQTQTNLARAIKTMSVVENARVQISVPMDKPLFKDQEKPPKAMVVVQPRKGMQLTTPMVEAIMETVAATVEGLDKTAVVVMDTSKNTVVSGDAFKQKSTPAAVGEEATSQLAVLQKYQEHWQKILTDQLEKVVGSGNASVIVNPVINWDRAVVEAMDYKGAGPGGQGIKVSEQTGKKSSDGTAAPATGQTPAGTTPNADQAIPGYPGTTGNQQQGNFSADEVNSIVNYLVNQTKTTTERPGGAIEEISVGVFVNGGTKGLTAVQETAMKTVVAAAMGSKARVELAALPFAPGLLDDFKNQPATATTGTPNWLYMLLAVALTLGAIGFFFVAMKPKRPVLEPVFAGPESAMMGGIPVSDLELAQAAEAYSSQQPTRIAGDWAGTVRTAEPAATELPALAPEEIALLGDEFLQQLGVDPAKVRMKEKVEKIAKVNPEAVAQLLKTWISEG
jgi:flagellar M-ring protein FliF